MLRHPQHGCPWDLEQDIDSLKRYTLEEVYEVIDTIEKKDWVELEDELGDLLFQVIFYARIAEEEGLFDFDRVAMAIVDKLVRRHPHVFPEGELSNFGKAQELSSEQVVSNWEKIKQVEREAKRLRGSLAQSQDKNSVLADIPVALPALERARKIQNRAARVGFDWQDEAPVIEKLHEEVAELSRAIESQRPQEIEEELGDVFFSLVNLSRHLGVDSETALRKANNKFIDRFHYIEDSLEASGSRLEDQGLEQLDKLWDEAKARVAKT